MIKLLLGSHLIMAKKTNNRKDIVPGSKYWDSARWFIKYYRRPKTQQERSVDPDVVPPRAKRNKRNLPSTWDDIPRSDSSIKSWKTRTKKRNQWD